VHLNGNVYRVAPLKMSQIESYVHQQTMNPAQMEETSWACIQASLRNAAGPDGAVPSIEELKNALDLQDFMELNQAVLAVSGLDGSMTPGATKISQ
jgi:hypothetical protein